MPTVLRLGAYQFSFYSNERGEPPHVHVRTGNQEAKVWLADCSVGRNRGFAEHELRVIARLVYDNREAILERWIRHFD